jgi:hypothetical protein
MYITPLFYLITKYFFNSSRALRYECFLLLRLLKASIPLLTIYAFSIFVFSLLAHLIFKDLNPNSYGDISESIWTQFLMIATNNFPDEYLVVSQEPLNVLYFFFYAIFLTINVIFMGNFIMSCFYMHYKYEQQEKLNNDNRKNS